ncbi:hypothetical protein C0J52_22422 [Blattella germanica]|nr:hypothetical protein C0J52_22422 [Blattella germanica]
MTEVNNPSYMVAQHAAVLKQISLLIRLASILAESSVFHKKLKVSPREKTATPSILLNKRNVNDSCGKEKKHNSDPNNLISSALLYCISNGAIPQEAKATSWFIEQISRWYDIMQSKHKNESLDQTDVDRVAHLRDMLQWFPALRFTGRQQWKPIQTGLQLSTTSALELCEDLSSRVFSSIFN